MSRMRGGSWVYQGSFSKTSAPGLRLGFLAASTTLPRHLVVAKQATDLHALPARSASCTTRLGRRRGGTDRLAHLVGFYRARRDVFEAGAAPQVPGDLSVSAGRRRAEACSSGCGCTSLWTRGRFSVRRSSAASAFMPGEEFSPRHARARQ
ncbi:MAG: hypothetical protein U0R65_02555 [Candidatus Nanopelagicales bacterium]